jgi:hypothetical protein
LKASSADQALETSLLTSRRKGVAVLVSVGALGVVEGAGAG